MAPCIFCEIIAGRAPASIVYQDDLVIAFLDIRPVNEGHLLVVPRQHAAGLFDLPPATGGPLFQVGQRAALALRNGAVPSEGENLVLANGSAAGQEVFHVHLHVIPRYDGDGFGFRFGPLNHPHFSRAELDETAARIRAGLI